MVRGLRHIICFSLEQDKLSIGFALCLLVVIISCGSSTYSPTTHTIYILITYWTYRFAPLTDLNDKLHQYLDIVFALYSSSSLCKNNMFIRAVYMADHPVRQVFSLYLTNLVTQFVYFYSYSNLHDCRICFHQSEMNGNITLLLYLHRLSYNPGSLIN